jgi:hypothetical protein
METLGIAGPPPLLDRKRSWRFWLFVISPILFLGMCGVFGMKAYRLVSRARDASALLHQQIEQTKYEEIYYTSSIAFQRSLTAKDLDQYLSAIRTRMGPCEPPGAPLNYFANANTNGTIVQLSYRLKCLDETISYIEEDGTPRLQSYQASSPFLLK